MRWLPFQLNPDLPAQGISRAEIEDKFRRNALFGGWSEAQCAAFLKSVPSLLAGTVDLRALRG